MTGYRLTQADRARIDPKNLCPKCDHLLRVPAQTITCGHRYCKECIDSVLRQENSKCIVDGAVLKKEEVFPDKFVEREILSFVLSCVYHDKGCHWKGELRHREAHEPSCEFGEVPCVHPECGIMIQRSELANHLQSICSYRAEACSFCQTMIVVATMTQHYQTCPSYPESCSECGKTDIPRCKMSLHLDPTVGDCEEVKALCPFEEIGCKQTKVMVLKERENHLKEEAPKHLGLLLNHVKETSLINSTLHQTAVNNANGSLIPLKQQVEKAFTVRLL